MAQEGSHRSCNFVHGGDLFTMFGIFGFYCFLLLPLGEIKMCIVHNRAESMVIAVLMLFAHFVCCCDLRSYGQQSNVMMPMKVFDKNLTNSHLWDVCGSAQAYSLQYGESLVVNNWPEQCF